MRRESLTKDPVWTPDDAAILLRVIAAIFDGGRCETARSFTTLAVAAWCTQLPANRPTGGAR